MQWTYNSHALSVVGDYETEEISGFLIPAIRGDNLMIPFVSGRTYIPKYFDQMKITLGITFMGSSYADTWTNIGTLKGYLNTLAQHTLRVVVPSGDTWTCEAEVIDFQGPIWSGQRAAKGTVTFLVAAGIMTKV